MDLYQKDKKGKWEPPRGLKVGSFWSNNLNGNSWKGDADVNVNVPVDWANTIQYQHFKAYPDRPKNPVFGDMKGHQVNHDTINWFVYRHALKELK